jgi:hypothetical protein
VQLVGLRQLTAAFALALMTATRSIAASAPPPSSDEVFTTRAFNIVPEDVARVEEISGSGDAIVLRVGIGVCRGGPGGPLVLRVHGAPADVFHIGQLIASGALLVNDQLHPAVRTVTAQELRTIGCSAPPGSDETFMTKAFAIGPENVERVTAVSSRGDLIVLHVTVGACTAGPDAPLILRVHGAPPHVFHVGQFVASGASAPPRERGIPAVRTVSAEELQRLGCPH